jgi:hypothetical protein
MLERLRSTSQVLLVGFGALSISAAVMTRAPISAAAGASETHAGITAGSPAAAPSSGSEFDEGGWQTVWRDNFNGPAGSGVNPSLWKYDTGQGAV